MPFALRGSLPSNDRLPRRGPAPRRDDLIEEVVCVSLVASKSGDSSLMRNNVLGEGVERFLRSRFLVGSIINKPRTIVRESNTVGHA